MSSPSTTAHESGPVEGPGLGSILRPIEAVGFWAAVGLPFVYLPLVITGLETGSEQLAVALLIAAHAVALYLGRHHNSR
ncbi:MAG: hypothetical protein ABEJ27_01100 [Halodesulfurarchaeum sp.]